LSRSIVRLRKQISGPGLGRSIRLQRAPAGNTITNAIIMVLPAGQKCIESQIVGYHSHMYVNPADYMIAYAWVRHDLLNGTFDLDSIISTLSHELVELITDPRPDQPAIVGQPGRCGGYACEIADVCEGQVTVFPGTSQHPSFAAQKYWSQNANSGYGGCV
jgi:hypothetical protein